MASYNTVVDFLPEDTKLMVSVKPSENLDLNLRNLLSNDLKKIARKGLYTVPLYLKAPLKIRFSISDQWRIQKELEKCKCITPVLPEKVLGSVNSAYQSISEVIESHRSSRGGTVYRNIFYFDDKEKDWCLLEKRRNDIYEPYSKDYEEKVSVYKNRTSSYLNPHPDRGMLFQYLLEQKEIVIKALQSKNEDQLVQIKKLNELFKDSKINVYREKLKELEDRMQKDYPETSGDNSWQMWIYKNSWIFATQYLEPLPKPQVGFSSFPDFLFPTLDGFVDILEIKKPTLRVIEKDKSHQGAYKWSKEANEAIGQVVNYLYEIELHQLEIAKRIADKYDINLSAVKPRGIILIGASDKWSKQEREALRKLNHSIHCIEVITYTDLLSRGKGLISIYDDAS